MDVCTVLPGPMTSGPQRHVEVPKRRFVGKMRYLRAVLGYNLSMVAYSAREPALKPYAEGQNGEDCLSQ